MEETIVIEPAVGPFEWLFVLVIALIVIIPFCRIFGRVGHPGWLGILMVIPLVNLFSLYYLAFSEWPAFRNKPTVEPVEPPLSPKDK